MGGLRFEFVGPQQENGEKVASSLERFESIESVLVKDIGRGHFILGDFLRHLGLFPVALSPSYDRRGGCKRMAQEPFAWHLASSS